MIKHIMHTETSGHNLAADICYCKIRQNCKEQKLQQIFTRNFEDSMYSLTSTGID